MVTGQNRSPGAHPVDDGSSVVVVSRLEPVAQRTELIRRASLLARLGNAQDLRVVLVNAPAGYGKTTLLTQWREHLLENGMRVAWLSLDEDENSPGEFVTYLVHTIQRAGLVLEHSLVTAAIPDDTAARHRLRQLLNILAKDGRRFVLMLDEFERLPVGSVDSIAKPLLKWAPPNLLVVLASRGRPSLPLARLRAQGLMQEVTAEELRFRRLDIERLFADELTSQEVVQVSRLTEGWPVAVQLLRGWRRDAGRSRNALASFNGLTDTLADYLSEQVFRSLPADLQSFLVEMAVLDRVSEGAAEFLTGQSRMWHTLLASQAIRPFLTTVEGDIGVYRLHPVVRQFLLSQFPLMLSEARQRALHFRAAHWYGRARQLSRAVRHAMLAGDRKLAGRLVLDAGGVSIWIRQGMARLKAVDALLDNELLEQFPRLQLLRALILAKDGAVAEARRTFDAVKASTDGFTVDSSGDDVGILHREGHLVEGTLFMNECRATDDDYLAAYQALMHDISGDDHIFQGNTKNFLCLALHQRGLFNDARVAAREAIQHYRHDNLPHGEFFSILHIGAIRFATGEPDAAESAYERAATIARHHFPEDRSKSLLLNALKADLAYERNQLDLAARRSAIAMKRLRRSEIWFDVYAAEFGTAAFTALQRDGVDAALALLTQADDEMKARQAVGLEPFLVATRMSCLVIAGYQEEARAHARALPGAPESYCRERIRTTQWREQEAVLMSFVRLAIAERRPRAIMGVLDAILPRLRASRNLHALVRLSLVHALARNIDGDRNGAIMALTEALTLAEQSGYVRVFFEDRSATAELLHDLSHDAGKRVDFPKAFATRLLDALGDGASAAWRAAYLTPRERQVLGELALGLSDKLIAKRLDISNNTVKFHLKNIYSKLGAPGRSAAVDKAREGGLIE